MQNLRPGVAGRLGLGFAELRAVNERLIYCSIGAFGSAGPRSGDPGYDPLMQAAAGVMSVTGDPDGPPSRAGVSLVDQGTGLWAVIAILAALRNRDEGAGAQLVETSLYEAAVNWLPYHVAGYLATGVVPRRQGSGIAMIAPYEAFQTADGSVMIAAANDRLFARLCDALERRDLLGDARFDTNSDRVANRAALSEALAGTLADRPTSEVLDRLRRAGVPAAPVQDVGEVVADPQTAALGLLQPLEHAAIDDLRLVALPISIDGRRVLHRAPPPRHGEHTAEVLGTLHLVDD
jgi:crotonobetainyl-CoA:carnitine CoA-transferase CaiB-like acyl-CoA transferase